MITVQLYFFASDIPTKYRKKIHVKQSFNGKYQVQKYIIKMSMSLTKMNEVI